MPFINGKYYMNPAYGRAVETLRETEERAGRSQMVMEYDGADTQDPGDRWVTIDHRHVLIHGRVNAARRAAIAATAKADEGDTSLQYSVGRPTCNLFVQREIARSGAPKPLVRKADGTTAAPSAAEWADSPVPGWRFLVPGEKPEPGDVAARKENFVDATGHSGIVTAVSSKGLVTVMAAHQMEIGKDMSFQPSSRSGPNNNVFRRYMGD